MDWRTGLRYSLEAVCEGQQEAIARSRRVTQLAQRARASAGETAEQARSVRSKCAETKVAAQHLRAESHWSGR